MSRPWPHVSQSPARHLDAVEPVDDFAYIDAAPDPAPCTFVGMLPPHPPPRPNLDIGPLALDAAIELRRLKLGGVEAERALVWARMVQGVGRWAS